ncbi:DUF4190 domain-containing protein [Agromyces mangrovi Wang et al. 2018]|uniref:DUF4190 domain-containing protein n=1 Tax=Agromyces mangrovi TaxID=1858653 RepID=UPI00257387C0|nr:DUF4190 domain-containing protein [Agromyces mangrovi]BDZ64049.1 hypothetical protein GCM10025877_09870 [Agromyces mangrovi]
MTSPDDDATRPYPPAQGPGSPGAPGSDPGAPGSGPQGPGGPGDPGAPGDGTGTPPDEPTKASGLGIAALVVGIVAVALAFWPIAWIAAIVLGVIGLVLGIIALTKKDRKKGVSTAGTVVSSAALVIAMIFGVLYTTGVIGTGDTPEPTATPTESASPTPTETTTPTPTPTPTQTVQEWADATWGTFDDVSQSGTGDGTVTLPADATGALVQAEHDGDDAFQVTVLDSSGSATGDPLVDVDGDYEGTTAYGVSDASAAVTLQITATGDWQVTVSQLSSASELPSAVSGEDDAVYLYGGDAATLAATHSGDDAEDPFVVRQQSEQAFSSSALIDVTGNFDGSAPLAAGPSVVTVQADEDWTITLG